jgi:hypothetical protein
MKNHYIKTNIRTSAKLYNELESTIYSLLIEDELISEENLVHMIIQQIKKEHGSMIYSSKEIRDSIKNLIDRKMIKEVVGPKLSKFINAQ